ncbi:hypothetical protein VNO80_08518 [Phaseolus coccineus]|uniref:Uncharacterized protein n=1 Tax=Phaseolus coccineus TaxID=3886 RepID=A0AAN9N4H6_PHACN
MAKMNCPLIERSNVDYCIMHAGWTQRTRSSSSSSKSSTSPFPPTLLHSFIVQHCSVPKVQAVNDEPR